MNRTSHHPDRALAAAAVREAVRQLQTRSGGAPLGRTAVDPLTWLGSGLSCNAWSAWCAMRTADGVQDLLLVARVPHHRAPAGAEQRLDREALLLERLNESDLSLRIPRPIASISLHNRRVWVQTAVSGLRLDGLNRGHALPDIALAAARIHAVPTESLRGTVSGPATYRQHAESLATEVAATPLAEAREAAAWMRENLPPDTPATLLHGDLLPQNLRPSLEEEQLGVIDWTEAQLGDPAYDLAVVTRGSRKPLGLEGGRERLLDAYARQASVPVAAPQLSVYELALVAGFWRQSAELYGKDSEAAAQRAAVLRRILRRVAG